MPGGLIVAAMNTAWNPAPFMMPAPVGSSNPTDDPAEVARII